MYSDALDWRLDPSTGDLDAASGEVPPVRGVEGLVQLAGTSLALWRSEWFRNRSEGVPYRERIFRKGSTKLERESVFQKAISALPGVIAVDALQVVDNGNRRLSVYWQARSSWGAVSATTTLRPFVIP